MKTPGKPCQYCGTPLSPSKKNPEEGYCYPCWKKWKDSQESRVVTDKTPVDDETIERMRTWANGAQAQLNTQGERILKLENEIKELSNLKTLMIGLTNKSAVELHSSMSGKPNDDGIPIIKDKDEVRIEDMNL